MNRATLNIPALQALLNASRAYFQLARKPQAHTASAGSISVLPVSRRTGSRENVPA